MIKALIRAFFLPRSVNNRTSANEKKARKLAEEEPVSKEDQTLEEDFSWATNLGYADFENPIDGTNDANGDTVAGIDELKALEATLSAEVMEAETEYFGAVSAHRECLNKLRDIRKDIESIEQAFLKKCEEYETVVEQNNTVVDSLNAKLETVQGKEAELSNVRDRIDELERITICVYASGEITVEDNSVDLDDSGSDELCEDLLHKDECQELRLREVNTLARLLKIVENGQLKAEVVCDSEELEKAFRLLTL